VVGETVVITFGRSGTRALRRASSAARCSGVKNRRPSSLRVHTRLREKQTRGERRFIPCRPVDDGDEIDLALAAQARRDLAPGGGCPVRVSEQRRTA
jgi:hypothetical protein